MDTAADPLAGLERMNPYEVMMSKRYQKTPRSQQFMELFRYIQGVNKVCIIEKSEKNVLPLNI